VPGSRRLARRHRLPAKITGVLARDRSREGGIGGPPWWSTTLVLVGQGPRTGRGAAAPLRPGLALTQQPAQLEGVNETVGDLVELGRPRRQQPVGTLQGGCRGFVQQLDQLVVVDRAGGLASLHEELAQTVEL
jgi:hypothetical protein